MNSCCLMSFLLFSCCEFDAGSDAFLTLGAPQEEPGFWDKSVRPPFGPSFLLTRHVVQPYLCEGHQRNWKVHFVESNRCRVQIAHCLSNLVSAL